MDRIPLGRVCFEDVSKRYSLGTWGTLRGAAAAILAGNGTGDARRVLWALRDVSFCVEPGESLGIIGPNGAGKTTTLKLLSHITRPTTGQVSVGGRVASLIELGAGFHPELTGRENVYLNGAILGLRQHEVRRRFDAIVDFSGLERFIDTPIKRYSSGMYVRLGFGIAAHVEADVILVDEVLAVGDSEFRQKCMARMEELRRRGTTLIFVSHNMYQVRRLCPQALLLVRGEPVLLGETAEAVLAYEKWLQQPATGDAGVRDLGMGEAPGTVMISGIALLDAAGQPRYEFCYDQDLTVRIAYRTRRPIAGPNFRLRVIRSDGAVCAMAASAYRLDQSWTLDGDGSVAVRFEPIQLVTGRYQVEVRIVDSTESMMLTSHHSDWFFVQAPAFGHEIERGFFVPSQSWWHEPGAMELPLSIDKKGVQ